MSLSVNSGLAAAQDSSSSSRADLHLAKGLALYQEREYDQAIAMFRAGYAIEPRREFIYALGQAERLSGDCRSAVIYYRRFLSRKPPARAARAAFEQISACELALASGPAAARDRAAVAVASSAAEPAPATPRRSRPWYTDPVGDVLLGSGALVLVGSVGLYSSARSTSRAAADADSYAEFDRLAVQASSRRNLAIGVSLGGAILVAGAVYRLGWGRKLGSERRVAAVPTTGGALVTFGGGF